MQPGVSHSKTIKVILEEAGRWPGDFVGFSGSRHPNHGSDDGFGLDDGKEWD